MKPLSKQEKPKKILITGASSGIGQELARLFAKDGHELFLFGRNQEALMSLQEELSCPTHTLRADLSTVEGKNLLTKAISDHVPDILINNAGLGYYGRLALQESQEMVSVNCDALMVATLVACDVWKKHHVLGICLNVASVAAFLPMPGSSVYGASKAFVVSFSEALDYEVRPFGIRVLVACPGRVATQFFSRAVHGKEMAQEKDWLVMSPQYAAKEIYWQISKQKSLHIFDWRYRFFVFLTKILPQKLSFKIIYSELKKRLVK